MRSFYLAYSTIIHIVSGQLNTASRDVIVQTPSAQLSQSYVYSQFPLPWSHYVKLLGVKNPEARVFYENEALRGGWSVRQLERQITTQFHERTLLSKNKAAMLKKELNRFPKMPLHPKRRSKIHLFWSFWGLRTSIRKMILKRR